MLDRDVRLPAGTWNRRMQESISPSGDGIGVAKGGEKGLAPATEHLPGLAIGFTGWIIGRCWDQ